MADKNDTTKASSTDKPGAETGAGGKVSAGTSVGNIGQAPMPQSQTETRSAQGGSTGAGAPKSGSAQGGMSGSGQGGQGGQGAISAQGGAAGQGGQQARGQSQSGQQGGQGGSVADKAQQAAEQVRQRASEAYEDTAEWAQDTYERVSDWASDTYGQQRRRMGQMRNRSGQSFGQMRGGVQNYVSENPMVVGLVGLAAGLLLGALLPRTRHENRAFGEWADEVRNQGLRYAREAAHRGREYVEENFSGDDAQFSRHESEFRPDRPDANRH